MFRCISILPFMVVLLISNILQWLYYFRHKGRITLPKIRFNITKDLGVSHGDDNFIMYKQWDPVEALKSEEDAKFTKKLVSMWTNFATHGKYAWTTDRDTKLCIHTCRNI